MKTILSFSRGNFKSNVIWKNNFLLSGLFILLFLTAGVAQNQFIFSVKTDNPGFSAPDQYMITTQGAGYNYNVIWGDGSIDNNVTGDITHTFPTPGSYIIQITGVFPRSYFGNNSDNEKLITIDQWGTTSWNSFVFAFQGCKNLTIRATDTPNLSGVSSMYYAFGGCSSLTTGNMSAWNTSAVTNMRGIFYGCIAFNDDISSWNTNMVSTLEDAFFQNLSFNQDISEWETGMVTNFQNTFKLAQAFDQNLGSWDMSAALNVNGMLGSSGLSIENYDTTLLGWASQVLPSNLTLDAFGLDYCYATSERNFIISNFGWTINGDNLDCTDIVLAEILEDSVSPGGSNNMNGTAVTVAQLFSIPGILDVFTQNEMEYQYLIFSTSNFSNLPTLLEVQTVIDEVNAVAQAVDSSLSGTLTELELTAAGIVQSGFTLAEIEAIQTEVAMASPSPITTSELQLLVDLAINSLGLFDFNQKHFSIYPNPTVSKVFFSKKVQEIIVRNSLGQVLGIYENIDVLDMHTFQTGIFYFTMEVGANFITRQVIKK